MQLLRDAFETQRHRQVNSQGMEKETPCKQQPKGSLATYIRQKFIFINSNQKEIWLPLLISDKTDFTYKTVKRQRKTFYSEGSMHLRRYNNYIHISNNTASKWE